MTLTPICDFVRAYADAAPVRLHMPGHKGTGPLGVEALDITEIDGADELFDPHGVIAESEGIASRLFGARTFFSAEGSSLAIRAMLRLALERYPARERPRVLAGRNAHRAFVSAAALLDCDVTWLRPGPGDTYHSVAVGPEAVEAALEADPGLKAVYLTSPDYLGHLADIAAVARVCHRHGAWLLVDNAHGAYLKGLAPSRHPIDLGADLCCDSAHKTLPALTGAAYLHLRPGLPVDDRQARQALMLFASTSPSWLILQSLDACNPALEALPEALSAFLPRLDALRRTLTDQGYALAGDEPMKLTLDAKAFGYTGDAMAGLLREQGLYCEFHDPDFLTLMPTPWNPPEDLARLASALAALPRRAPIPTVPPPLRLPPRALTIREAALAPRETLPADRCLGRTLAASALCCPPCVPIALCGEVIDEAALEALRYYDIKALDVVK